MVESSKKVKPWRQAVIAAIIDQREPGIYFDGAVRLTTEFIMPRLKAMSPRRSTPYHITAPDLDKLLRSTLDGITDSGVWRDDSIVCKMGNSIKRYAEPGEPTGAVILIEAL
jgi:crossover junction endodeoxyribonuclease RusA